MKINKTKTTLGVLTLGILFLATTLSASLNCSISGVAPTEQLLVIKNNKLIFDIYEDIEQVLPILEKGIVKAPEFGVAKFFEGESVTYTPNQDVCEEIDVFSYYIKTSKGIDTVEISVEILCESLTIMSGFTPDGDGINDSFIILGVQNYPNNSLLIFNKWGEQVYEKKGYKNDWQGESSKGEHLASEDSVYYYVFQDGAGKSYSGHLQILAKT